MVDLLGVALPESLTGEVSRPPKAGRLDRNVRAVEKLKEGAEGLQIGCRKSTCNDLVYL